MMDSINSILEPLRDHPSLFSAAALFISTFILRSGRLARQSGTETTTQKWPYPKKHLISAALLSTAIPAVGAYMSSSEPPDTLQGQFKTQVVDFCQTHIADHSPFDPGREELSVADTIKFFNPANGNFWTFYRKNESELKKQHFLERHVSVVMITNNLFPEEKSSEPRLNLEFKPHGNPRDVEWVHLQIDGKGVPYKNQAVSSLNSTWPSANKNPNASLEVKFNDGEQRKKEYSGTWGLIRLLQAGEIEDGIVRWKFERPGGQPVIITFAVQAFGLKDGLGPLLNYLGRKFECPTRL
jgi:type VI protein secretion system component VasK